MPRQCLLFPGTAAAAGAAAPVGRLPGGGPAHAQRRTGRTARRRGSPGLPEHARPDSLLRGCMLPGLMVLFCIEPDNLREGDHERGRRGWVRAWAHDANVRRRAAALTAPYPLPRTHTRRTWYTGRPLRFPAGGRRVNGSQNSLERTQRSRRTAWLLRSRFQARAAHGSESRSTHRSTRIWRARGRALYSRSMSTRCARNASSRPRLVDAMPNGRAAHGGGAKDE